VKRKSALSAVVVLAVSLAVLTGADTVVRVGGSPLPEGPLIYLDPSSSPQERAADLVSRMTLREKAAEMNSSQAAPIKRLGVAAYGWWNEAAHGVAREQTVDGANPPTLMNTTSYPVDLSLGSTWNPDLIYQEATLISDEAREVAPDNRLDLDYYSPTVNLARDPRWGRNDETFSEDPLLTGALAAQFVNGMQGLTEQGQPLPGSGGYRKTLTTLKHYAANNSEFNRLTGSSDMDERTLREYYTAQFRDVIRATDPGSIMSAYNQVNGVPSAANVHLIDTLARQTYGFDGYFTSDCDAVYVMDARQHWTPQGAAAPVDRYSRVAYAQSAGEDLNCDQGYHDADGYGQAIPGAVARHITTQTGLYTENAVDVSLVRLFTARIELGEFDAENQVPWVAQARQRLARGTWVNSNANRAVTETPQRLAMARSVADQSIVLLKNDPVAGRALLPLAVPPSGAYKLAVIGSFAQPGDMYLGGYASNQGPAGVAKEVNGYQGLKAAVQAINPAAHVDFLPGTQAANFEAVDPASVAAAAGYDAVIVYAGTDAHTATEDTDRTSLALPGAQADLIRQVAAVNPHTVVYLETIGQVDVSGFAGAAPALLWSSYNGQVKGQALADVVTGAVSPSGHLPFTWYANENQLPDIGDYAIRPTATTLGRTYQYFTGDVSYPFGYGRSYTDFRYDGLTVDRDHVDADGQLTATATVTNTGSVPGDDVVQLYVTTPDAPAAAQRPRKRLVAFRKVSLAPGQATQVSFPVKVADLAFFDGTAGVYAVDAGRYGFQLASSAADADVWQQAFVTVSGALHPQPAVVTAKPVAIGDAAAGIAQRVIFPAGSRIDPQLTVALSDESLYGYVTKGAGRPLPPGMEVMYVSNRPQVVSVGPAGLVAHAPGVATVTATVRYGGGEATGSFVISVR
jgi:beta-glucosidase